MNVTYDFSDRVVLLTGAGGNLGSAAARAFFRAGAKLALLEYQRGVLESELPELAASQRVLPLEGLDVTNPEAVQRSVNTVVERFGRIDVLVNTVGGYQAGKPLHETGYDVWEKMMNLNAGSVFTMCHETLPYMLQQESGSVINIAAAPALKGSANSSAYGAAKTAVARLTESMAAEYKDQGIRVNALLPMVIDTPQNREAMPTADFSQWVTPEALAQVILFLASDAAEPVNGVLLPVFGRKV